MRPARRLLGTGSNLQAQADVWLDHMDLGDDEKGALSCRAGFPTARLLVAASFLSAELSSLSPGRASRVDEFLISWGK